MFVERVMPGAGKTSEVWMADDGPEDRPIAGRTFRAAKFAIIEGRLAQLIEQIVHIVGHTCLRAAMGTAEEAMLMVKKSLAFHLKSVT